MVVAALCALPLFRRRMRCGGRRSVAASGGPGRCSKRIFGASDAPGAGDVLSRRDRPWRLLWWSATSICAQPQQPDLSEPCCRPIGLLTSPTPLPSQVYPRRVRRAAKRRCGQSRGSPSEAAVVGNGSGLRAASAAAVAGAAAGKRADTTGGGEDGCSTSICGAVDAA